MKVYVITGTNKLFNASGPVAVASTAQKAEQYQRYFGYMMDESRIEEFEVNPQVDGELESVK